MTENNPSRTSISIRYAIPGLLALLIIIALGLTGWFSYQNGVASVEILAKRLNLEVTRRIEERIVSFVEPPKLFHQINLSVLESTNTQLEQYDLMRKLFWNEVYISDSVPYLYYGTEDGYFLGIDTKYKGDQPAYKILNADTVPNRVTYSVTAGGQPKEQLESKEYDPRVRDWYKAAVAADSFTWSPIYSFSALKELGISPVIPVKTSQGKLLGVLGIDLTLGELSNFLRKLDVSPNGEAFIIERDGNMVATSTDQPPYAIVNDVQVRLNVKDSDSQLLRDTTEYLLSKYGDFAKISKPEPLAFEKNGEKYYAQVNSLNANGIDWLVVVVVPESDFMAQVTQNLRNTTLLGIAALILSTILGYLLAGWIIRPVFTITGVAANIEEQKWELDPLTIVSNRTDELGQLARVFQKMAQELRAREQALRQQVRELSIQIDQSKREQQVKDIVDNDFFIDLQKRAADIRKRSNRKNDEK